VNRFSDPATYQHDSGGPSLFGILLVHCGPGVLAAIILLVALARRRGTSRAAQTQPDRVNR
jgi:hypothetical protein